MCENEIVAVYNQGKDAVITFVKGLDEKVQLLENRVKELEAQKSKNSQNSSKPPSTDGFKRTKSLREKSDRPTGGQEGHIGHTLEMSENPDHVITHKVSTCSHCNCSLEGVEAEGYDRRQVYDIPPIELESTEHRAERVRCPKCKEINEAQFPKGVDYLVQYGPSLKGVSTYLTNYQFIPLERTVELLSDILGAQISEGTLVNVNQACYEKLATTEDEIKEQLKASKILHVDETGSRINGKLHWTHVASNDKLTYYGVHEKRGSKATEEMGILPNYEGTAVHDNWKPYRKYENCSHALCNAHHLRELTGVEEIEKQEWAKEMKGLLVGIENSVKEEMLRSNTMSLPDDKILVYESRYDSIIEKGIEEDRAKNGEYISKGKRGRVKKSKARNLLDRLAEQKQETLAFMYDFSIPFDNNQAERDIRMIKVKQKVSGGFRSDKGAKVFCRIRGYISTAKKNSVNVLEAITNVFNGTPFVPQSG